jgi:hypothetical protein
MKGKRWCYQAVAVSRDVGYFQVVIRWNCNVSPLNKAYIISSWVLDHIVKLER